MTHTIKIEIPSDGSCYEEYIPIDDVPLNWVPHRIENGKKYYLRLKNETKKDQD